MLFVVECGEVFDCFLVESYKMLDCGRRYLALAVTLRLSLLSRLLQDLFVLVNSVEQLFNLVLLDDAHRSHLALLQFLLPVVALVNYTALLLKVGLHEVEALVGYVGHVDAKDPGLFVVHLPPADSQPVGGIKIALNIINRGQCAPGYQLPHALHLSFWLQNQEYLLADDYIHVDLRPLLHFLALDIFGEVLLLLSARVNSYHSLQLVLGRLACQTLHPNLLVVVIEA